MTLIEDIKTIIVERVTNSRQEIIRMKWEIGDRIFSENIFSLSSEELKEYLSNLTWETRISMKELKLILKFRQKYPDLEMLPFGKNISWDKIKEELNET